MKNIKKVAQVTRRFSLRKWGGTENVVFEVSKELVGRKIDSPVFCTDMLERPGVQPLDNVAVHRFRYCFPWLFLSKKAKQTLELKGGSPLSLRLFWGLLTERDLSLIHTHVQHRLGGMARTVARLKKIPYVVSLHGGYFTLPEEQVEKMTRPFRGKLEWGKAFGAVFGSRRVLEDADAIICVGQDEVAEVRQRFPEKSVHYLPNGVDVQRFSEVDGEAFRSKYGYQPLEKIVLCVSRIDYQKNQGGLVRVFAEFSEKHPDHRLVLIGPVTVEAYYDDILREINRLDLSERVRIIEGIEPTDPLLVSAYKASEMFVLTSVHEPFGMVVLEAWAAGLPVIAHRIGGIPGFVKDEETALLVEPENEHDLLTAMDRLAGDIALRGDLSRKAFGEVASTYDWSKIVDQLLSIYSEIIKG